MKMNTASCLKSHAAARSSAAVSAVARRGGARLHRRSVRSALRPRPLLVARAASEKDEAVSEEERGTVKVVADQAAAEGDCDCCGDEEQKERPLRTTTTNKGEEEKPGGLRALLDNVLSFAPGLSKENIEAFTDWRVAHKNLTDFGLESVTAEAAAKMVEEGKAILVDVRTGAAHSFEHAESSVSLPYFDKVKGSSTKRVFLGASTTAKNPNFVSDASALIGSDKEAKTIIVYCSTGGTLKNTITKRDGSTLEDSQRSFGRESLSLRAADELIAAGYTNIKHMEGGFPAWIRYDLPCAGTNMVSLESLMKKLPEPKKADPNAWPNVHARLVEAGIDSLDATEAAKMVEEGKAIIIDVDYEEQYDEDHIENSVNVPFKKVITAGGIKVAGGLAKGVVYSGDPLEPNPDFLSLYKKLDAFGGGSERTVIVTCSRGGSVRTEVVSKRGKVFKDPQLKHGRESPSLRAMAALIDAGFENLAHLNGGNPSWKEAKLPTTGNFLMTIQGEDAVGWRIATYMEEEDAWFKGKVTAFKGDGKYAVRYDRYQEKTGQGIAFPTPQYDLGEGSEETDVEVALDMNRTRWLNKQGAEKKLKPLQDGRYPTGRNVLERQQEQREIVAAQRLELPPGLDWQKPPPSQQEPEPESEQEPEAEAEAPVDEDEAANE